MALSKPNQLHFVMVPFMIPGYIIPLIDMAKLIAQRGVKVTIVTTPVNAHRFGAAVALAHQSGLPISFLELHFPSVEVGLPQGCESLDALPSEDFVRNFLAGVDLLQCQLEQYFLDLDCYPSCIISNKYVAWTADTAKKFQIPRILFDGMSCFTQLCIHNLYVSKVYESVAESELFVIPGLPDCIELTRSQLPQEFNQGEFESTEDEIARQSDEIAYGVIIDNFEELEQEYVREYKKLKNGKVWCIGPLSLCNKDESQKSQRGSKASIDEKECLKWLDSREPGSVVYACLGSLSRVDPAQLMELGLGLGESNHPFIWVARTAEHQTQELEKLIEENGFEERTKNRGLVIQGWAPQILILSHPAIGAFLTHCGWNSTLEGVSAGVPMVTWPQMSEQFFNEKLIVQVLGIGESVGAKSAVEWGEKVTDEKMMKSKELKKAIDKVMSNCKEGGERRKRAAQLAKIASKATEEGSSHLNLTRLIQDISELAKNKKSK